MVFISSHFTVQRCQYLEIMSLVRLLNEKMLLLLYNLFLFYCDMNNQYRNKRNLYEQDVEFQTDRGVIFVLLLLLLNIL